MIKIPDAASIAAMRVLSDRLFRRVGGSTGTNFFALCWVAANMIAAGEEGSLVSLICDSGERYTATYYNDAWLQSNNIEIESCWSMLRDFLDMGRFRFDLVDVKTAQAIAVIEVSRHERTSANCDAARRRSMGQSRGISETPMSVAALLRPMAMMRGCPLTGVNPDIARIVRKDRL